MCIAEKVCRNDSTHVVIKSGTVTYKVTKEATDTEKGEITYIATFSDPAFRTLTKAVRTDRLSSGYQQAVYVWADDNSTVTETRVYTGDAGKTVTETVRTTSEVTKKATCAAEGETVYTATFESELLTTQTKAVPTPKLTAHTPSETVVEYSKYATCTASGMHREETRCSVCGELIGIQKYPVSALGHSWCKPSYTWSADNSKVTAKRVCAHDRTHTESETVSTEETLLTEKTETGNGIKLYIVSFENKAFTGSAAIKPDQKLTLFDLAIKAANAKGAPQNIILTAAAGGMKLDNVKFEGKKVTVNAGKGNLEVDNISAGDLDLKGSAKTALTVGGDVTATTVTGFDKLVINVTLAVTKTLTVNEIEIATDGVLIVGKGAQVTVKNAYHHARYCLFARGVQAAETERRSERYGLPRIGQHA